MKKLFILLILGIFLINMISATNRTIVADGGWSTDTDNSCKGDIFITNNYSVIIHGLTMSSSSTDTVAYILFQNTTTFKSASIVGGYAYFGSMNLSPSTTYYLTSDGGANSLYKAATTPISVTDGHVDGYITACPSSTGANTVFGILSVDIDNGTAPTFPVIVNLTSPLNNSQTISASTLFNSTITPNTFSLTNATFNVWFSNGTLFTAATNTTFNGNISTYNIILPIYTKYYWNVLGVQGNGNGTNSTYSIDNYTYTYSFLSTNQYFYNLSNYETSHDYYTVNITSNGTAPTAASFIYNNTMVVQANITSLGNNFYNLTVETDIPSGISNNSFYFNASVAGLVSTTSIAYQDILNSSLVIKGTTNCNAGWLSYLNISIVDENNLSSLNGINPSTTIYYWLGSGTKYKTLTTSNTSANGFYSFCFAPQNQTLKANLTFQYSATGYPARTYINNSMSLTNATTNLTFYSLNVGKGIYVTFQVINNAQQVLSGVISNVTRAINGQTAIIGAGTTGGDGGITYWLDADNSYTANFFLTGYPFYTTTQQFTQTQYTITIGTSSSSSTTAYNYQQGVSYSIRPSLLNYLSNNTIYNFNFTINSTYWNLERFGFNITDENGNLLGSTSNTTGNGGIALLDINTSSYSKIVMNAYWTANSTNTTQTFIWLVSDTSGQHNISKFFSDLKTYLTNGKLFGLDNFGIGIICFVIIIGITGVLKTKVGMSNMVLTLGIFWALVALFDVSFGLIPNPVNAIPNFPTFLIGAIFAGVAIKEIIQ